jgi:hypothetical protein
MKLNLDRHRAEYHNDLLTVVPDVIDADLLGAWNERVEQLLAAGRAIRRDEEGRGGGEVLDGGGAYRHFVLDGLMVRQHLPGLMVAYEVLKHVIAAVTLHDVRTAARAYPRSAVNVKVYRGEGSQQGWHYDTNAITGLLYLTTNREGGTLCRIPRDHPVEALRTHQERRVLPVAGSLLIMQGRRVWHRAEPMTAETKVVAPLNYYTADDLWRPEGIDDLVYGKAAVPHGGPELAPAGSPA